MSLTDAVEKFNNTIQNLSSLEVTTYTGSLSQIIDSNTGEIDWDKFKPNSGELVLVAATRIQADYDTISFLANDAENIGDIDRLLELHQGAVESAQAGRLALLHLFPGLLGLS